MKKQKIEKMTIQGKEYDYIKCPRCEIYIPAKDYNMKTGEHPDCDKYFRTLKRRRKATQIALGKLNKVLTGEI